MDPWSRSGDGGHLPEDPRARPTDRNCNGTRTELKPDDVIKLGHRTVAIVKTDGATAIIRFANGDLGRIELPENTDRLGYAGEGIDARLADHV